MNLFKEFFLIVAGGFIGVFLGGLFGGLVGTVSPEFIAAISGPNPIQMHGRVGMALGMIMGLMIGAVAMAAGRLIGAVRLWAERAGCEPEMPE